MALSGAVVSDVPDDLCYTEEHEWLCFEGDEVVVGITDHAQEALTDIVYVELPDVGDSVEAMGDMATVDSVKSSSPIHAPRSGVISAVNEALEDVPERINEDPYGEGWVARILLSDTEDRTGLLDAAAYRALIGG